MLWLLLKSPELVSIFALVASSLLLVPIQKTMNKVNTALYPDPDPKTRFTAWNIAAIALAALVSLYVLWLTFGGVYAT